MGKGRLFTVLGGTGFLGSRIAQALLAQGHAVRIAARHPGRCRELPGLFGAEPVEADLFDADSLAAAFAGAEAVVNATSLYVERGKVTFEAVHVDGARRAARQARTAGAARFVQISGIGADAGAGDAYVRARGHGEDAVRWAFGDAAIVRPAAMFGPGDALISAILSVGRRLPLYPLFGKGQTRMQPVDVGDVARAVAALMTDVPPRATCEFGGPRILTYRALVDEVLRTAGFRSRPVPVPFAAWRIVASLAEHLPGAPLTRGQIALVERDNVANPDLPGLDAFGIEPRDVVDHVRDVAGGADARGSAAIGRRR